MHSFPQVNYQSCSHCSDYSKLLKTFILLHSKTPTLPTTPQPPTTPHPTPPHTHTDTLSGHNLRMFAPIASAYFWRMSRTRHASPTTKVNNHGIEAQTFSRIMERKSVWHHGIAVDPGLLGNVTQVVTV